MPGPTATEIFARGGLLDTKLRADTEKDDPRTSPDREWTRSCPAVSVAAASLKTKAQALLSRFLPGAVKARVTR